MPDTYDTWDEVAIDFPERVPTNVMLWQSDRGRRKQERNQVNGTFSGWDKGLLEQQVRSLAKAAEVADDQNQANLWALHDALTGVLAENDDPRETRTLHVELEELLEAARKNGRFPMEPTITQLFADHQGVDHLLDGEYVFTGSDNTVTVTPLLTFEVTGIWVTDDED